MDMWWIFSWISLQYKPRQHCSQDCELLNLVNTLDKRDRDVEMCEKLRNVGFYV